MDKVSDDELTMLIEKWADPVQALEEGLLELPALTELRDRRQAEKTVTFEWTCGECEKTNLWSWLIEDFEPWEPMKLLCEYCEHETMFTDPPRRQAEKTIDKSGA